MVICRLYEADIDASMPPSLKQLLYNECFGCDSEGQNHAHHQAHPDPFVRSMAYWMLKDYTPALGQ